MRRCQHKNGRLIEQMTTRATRRVRDNEVGGRESADSFPVNRYLFLCDDCERGFTFRPDEDMPNWLILLINQI